MRWSLGKAKASATVRAVVTAMCPLGKDSRLGPAVAVEADLRGSEDLLRPGGGRRARRRPRAAPRRGAPRQASRARDQKRQRRPHPEARSCLRGPPGRRSCGCADRAASRADPAPGPAGSRAGRVPRRLVASGVGVDDTTEGEREERKQSRVRLSRPRASAALVAVRGRLLERGAVSRERGRRAARVARPPRTKSDR